MKTEKLKKLAMVHKCTVLTRIPVLRLLAITIISAVLVTGIPNSKKTDPTTNCAK